MMLVCPICGHTHKHWDRRPKAPGTMQHVCMRGPKGAVCECEVSLGDALAAMQVRATYVLAATYALYQPDAVGTQAIAEMAAAMQRVAQEAP